MPIVLMTWKDKMPGMAHGSLRKRWLALSVSRCDCSVGIGVPDVADGWSCMGFHLHWGFLYTAKRKANSRSVGNTEECGGSSASMLTGSMESGRTVGGAVRKNTLAGFQKTNIVSCLQIITYLTLDKPPLRSL